MSGDTDTALHFARQQLLMLGQPRMKGLTNGPARNGLPAPRLCHTFSDVARRGG
jgi:hypothetical protein